MTTTETVLTTALIIVVWLGYQAIKVFDQTTTDLRRRIDLLQRQIEEKATVKRVQFPFEQHEKLADQVDRIAESACETSWRTKFRLDFGKWPEDLPPHRAATGNRPQLPEEG